jgi:hypothetical protein
MIEQHCTTVMRRLRRDFLHVNASLNEIEFGTCIATGKPNVL